MVEAMQWLRKLHLDVKVPHLCSEVVVLIEMWCPPLLVQFSQCPRLVSKFNCRSLKIVRAEFSGCMKDVFKPFLMIRVAGTVFVFSLTLNKTGSHKSKSAFAGNLTLCPNRRSTGVLSLVFEVLQYVISALCRNAPIDTLKLGLHAYSARFTEPLFQLVHLLLDDRRVIPFF